MEERVYFVVDMKSFFASVECAERGLDPMETLLVVADTTRGKNTICLAVTPKMKSLGVPNRCRLYEIPSNIEYITASPRMKKYIEYASKIYAIYLKYIDKSDIHVYSIDECFIDVTSYLKLYKTTALDFAKKLIGEIYEKLHIPASVGIGTNMYLAKIALDITAKKSKDRIGYLDEKKYIKTLWNHKPLNDFWQISDGISSRLKKFGVVDMEGIAKCDEDVLYREFGINAELIIDHAWGKESCKMCDIKSYKNKSKSLSSSQILPRNYDFESARLVMLEMVQNGCYDLSKNHVSTRSVNLYISYGDIEKGGVKGHKRMSVVTNLYSIISQYALSLFDEIVDKTRPIRKIGYAFCDLVPEEFEQYDFFVDQEQVEKEKHLVDGVLKIHDKYGKNSMLKGLDLEENATQKERNLSIGGHRSGEE